MPAEGEAFLDATMPHLDAVHRVALNLSPDRWQAEDLTQETYLRAFAAFDRFRGGDVRSWLVAICLNLTRSRWRARASAVTERPLDGTEHLQAADTDTADLALREVRRESVVAALRELPAEQREAIVLTDIAGYTAAEAANLLGCPRGTVLARVHRGRRRLAVLLIDAGVDHDLP